MTKKAEQSKQESKFDLELLRKLLHFTLYGIAQELHSLQQQLALIHHFNDQAVIDVHHYDPLRSSRKSNLQAEHEKLVDLYKLVHGLKEQVEDSEMKRVVQAFVEYQRTKQGK
jgi:hypothetical protein